MVWGTSLKSSELFVLRRCACVICAGTRLQCTAVLPVPFSEHSTWCWLVSQQQVVTVCDALRRLCARAALGHSALVVFGRGSRCVLCGGCLLLPSCQAGQINRAVLEGLVVGGHLQSWWAQFPGSLRGCAGNLAHSAPQQCSNSVLGVSYELVCVWLWLCVKQRLVALAPPCLCVLACVQYMAGADYWTSLFLRGLSCVSVVHPCGSALCVHASTSLQGQLAPN